MFENGGGDFDQFNTEMPTFLIPLHKKVAVKLNLFPTRKT
jgi:hypothetical protein